jgi:thiamine monophosphate synthase
MFFNLNKKNFFYFGKNIDNKKNLLKFKNLSYIFLWDRSSDIKQVIEVRDFCKVNKIKFYISNNINLAKLVKADGIHLPSDYKRRVYNLDKKMEIIGTAHSHKDYFIKKGQMCKSVFLSPIFFNKKYSKNKILGPIKFNLITKFWKIKVNALGGIKLDNLRRIGVVKLSGVGGISLFS